MPLPFEFRLTTLDGGSIIIRKDEVGGYITLIADDIGGDSARIHLDPDEANDFSENFVKAQNDGEN